MFVSFVQPWNAQLPIVVTVVGMAIEASFSQQSKAASPISVSFADGKYTLVIPLQ